MHITIESVGQPMRLNASRFGNEGKNMFVTIENNKVVVNLDKTEFPKFEAMFNNLKLDKTVRCDFRKFNFPDFETKRDILLMHLCRTIGEANLSANPFATMSLYPFWKYGSATADSGGLPKTGQGGFRNIIGSVRKEPFFSEIDLIIRSESDEVG